MKIKTSIILLLFISNLNAQIKDSTNKIFLRKMITPVVLAAGATFFLQEKFKEKQHFIHSNNFKSFHTNIDDYIQYSPSLAFLIASFAKKDDRKDRLIRGLLATSATNGSTWILKRVFKMERPDSSDFLSFPSGHTTNTFTGAAILSKEFGGRANPLVSILGYSVASSTGFLRMANNKHWLSDILAGAAIGIGGTEVSYFLYPKIKKLLKPRKNNQTFIPYYDGRSTGFVSSFTF